MPSINAKSSDSQLIELGLAVAKSVRAAMLGVESHGMTGAREGQYAFDVVADNAALAVLREVGVRVLSEESGVEAGSWPLRGDELLAILDPLDGSTNADRGIPWFSTSIAFVDAKGLRAAVVVNQISGDEFTATRGGGAFRNGESIRVADEKLLSECVVGLSGLPKTNPGWWQFRVLGSAALDLCLVASGGLDAWVDCESHGVWDYAGGMLIVAEAGGTVQEVFGMDPIHADYEVRRTIVAAASDAVCQQLKIFRK